MTLQGLQEAIGVLLMAALTFVGGSCAHSPTGRNQLTLMSDGQMNQMGVQSFDDLKKKTPQETDPAWNGYIKCITGALLKIASDPTGVSSWETVVFKDPTPNAFALPGGKIGVHTGILSVAKTDGQLAAVLGHEIGHVIARHGNERVSQGMIAQGIMVAADAFTKNSAQKPVLMGMLGVGTQVGVLLPFSRSHESEADRIGLDLMAKAGFNPDESVKLWQNMSAAAGGKGPPEFLSTHPSDKTRMENLSRHIPQVRPEYQAVVSAGKAPQCTRPANAPK